jgi:ceramide glucosyltransferase
MAVIQLLAGVVGLAGLAIAATYNMLALAAVRIWRRRAAAQDSLELLPVTVLKPLCGSEPGLYENLRTFCHQDYPKFQIIFGVLEPADPAIGVARRLLAEFPDLQIDIVVNTRQHGSNRKVSNLVNMMTHARYGILAIADSDTSVRPDYLRNVTTPLLDPQAGLVTCIYRGIPTNCVWSRLGAMYVNEWYMPSVLLAWMFGHQSYVSGQTMCIRRETLQAIGGLLAVANHLADDYCLGELVRGQGLRTVTSSYLLEAEHHEPDLPLLIGHELRWMSTLRVLRPWSFRFIFLTFSLPLALLGFALAAAEPLFAAPALALFQFAVGTRLALHFTHRWHGTRPLLADLWLLPVRDFLLCWVWYRSFFARRITWRGKEFDLDAEGTMRGL